MSVQCILLINVNDSKKEKKRGEKNVVFMNLISSWDLKCRL